MEILIAIVMLALGFILYASTSGSIVSRNAKSSHETTATTLAQDKLEAIKSIALSTSLGGADGLDSPVYSAGWSATTGGELIDAEGATGGSDALYTRTWTITTDGTLYYFYTVEATVAWENGSVTLTSQISQ